MLFFIIKAPGMDLTSMPLHVIWSSPFWWLAFSFAQASLPTLGYQTAEGEGGRCLCRVATALLVLAF